MRKLLAAFWALFLFLQSVFVFAPVFAQSSIEEKAPKDLAEIQEKAKKSNIVYLGEKLDKKTGKLAKGYLIISRTPEAVAQLAAEGFAPITSTASTCWQHTGQMKWKTNEGFLINPANTRGVDTNYIVQTHTNDINKWEDASTGAIDANSQNIVGNLTQTSSSLSVDLNSPDGQNEVYFGAPSVANAIAATTIWAFPDEIVEADMVFNDVDYDWGTNGEVNKMDFENISTHELGHVMGMADIYDASCTNVTMYGYSAVGDTIKRTLDQPDVTGIANLYDMDGDNVVNALDNCVQNFNPTQANYNGETFDLGPSFPFDDATNANADKEGDICDTDVDGDGLLNTSETSTSLTNPDSDGDRVLDGAEVVCGSDPANAASTPKNPSGDGLAFLADTDRDMLPDSCESIIGTNPALVDTDGDKLTDGNEYLYKGTNPFSKNSDGDECRDDFEVATVNADRSVNALDLSQAAQRFGVFGAPSGVYNKYFDYSGDGSINAIDLSQIAQKFGSCSDFPF